MSASSSSSPSVNRWYHPIKVAAYLPGSQQKDDSLAGHLQVTMTPLKVGPLQVYLIHKLTCALEKTGMLAPLIQLISEYTLGLLTTSPQCYTLHPPQGSRFIGCHGGCVGADKKNALFLATLRDSAPFGAPPAPHMELIQIEEVEETLVSNRWKIPYATMDITELRVVEIRQGEFYFETFETWAHASESATSLNPKDGESSRPIAIYDPDCCRIWRKKNCTSWVNSSTINLSVEGSSCRPHRRSGSFRGERQDILFGHAFSFERMLSVHRDAIRLFDTASYEKGNYRQLHSYSVPTVPFTTATSIPRSNRFIAALFDTRIIYFTADLENDSTVIQRDFVIKDQGMDRSGSKSPIVLTLAANSSAVAIVDSTPLSDPSSCWSYPLESCGPWDYSMVSLWDHETTQNISHFKIPTPAPIFNELTRGCARWNYLTIQESWLGDNNLLVLSHLNEGRTFRFVDTVSIIDFRIKGTQTTQKNGTLLNSS